MLKMTPEMNAQDTDEAEWTDEALLTALNSAEAEVSLNAARHLRNLPAWRVGSLVRHGLNMRAPANGCNVGAAMILFAWVVISLVLAGRAGSIAALAVTLVGFGCLLQVGKAVVNARGPDMSKCFDRLALHISSLRTAQAFPTVLGLMTGDEAAVAPPVIRRALHTAAKNILESMSNQEFDLVSSDILALMVRILAVPYDDIELSAMIISRLAGRADPFDLELRNLLFGLAGQSAPTPGMKRVRDAARAALEQLAERREEQKIAQSLVRASDRPDRAEHLLRPAAGSLPSAEELVRPDPIERRPVERP